MNAYTSEATFVAGKLTNERKIDRHFSVILFPCPGGIRQWFPYHYPIIMKRNCVKKSRINVIKEIILVYPYARIISFITLIRDSLKT